MYFIFVSAPLFNQYPKKVLHAIEIEAQSKSEIAKCFAVSYALVNTLPDYP